MTLRILALSLSAVFLVLSPAAASQPEGLAGEITMGAGTPPVCYAGFEWNGGGYEMPLGPADTLTLEIAIVPFPSGVTSVGIDFGPFAPTAVYLSFLDGLVAGVPYNRNGWNDVVVQVYADRQEFEVTVNGGQAGPFPFGSDCGGVCSSVLNFRINGSNVPPGSPAWVDSISLVRHTPDGYERYYDFTADPCSQYTKVYGGGLVFLEPPRKLRPTK